ncbi:MAG: glycosyltransferase family 4 protein, partial [Solirubrobacteraceae bacterium]
ANSGRAEYRAARRALSRLHARAGDFDLVHVHGRPLLAALSLTRPLPLPIVFTPAYYAESPRSLRRLEQGRGHHPDRDVAAVADLVLCVSNTEALQVQRFAPDARIAVVPGAVNQDAIAIAEPLPVGGRPILTIDRLTRWTGVHRIISALPALSPSFELIVIGHGHARGALEAHAQYLRVADRVQFLGAINRTDGYRWLRTASVVVALKEASVWGGLLLSATCAGVPVVASDIPANREADALIGHTGTRFVSRRASPFVVADAIREQALAGSRPRPERVPTWTELTGETLNAYRETLRHATPERRAGVIGSASHSPSRRPARPARSPAWR